MYSRNRGIFFATWLSLAGSALAQLDLGSSDVPQSQIDAYAAPFFKLISAGLGSDRALPPRTGTGWEVDAASILLPIPGGQPFQNADISVLPLFRLSGGLQSAGASVGIRGMAWHDPRTGDIFTYGGNLAYARPIAQTPWSAGAEAGWDYLSFGSSFSQPYEGSSLVLQQRGDISGDYTLIENDGGAGVFAAFQKASWRFYAQSGPEWVLARFRYLYTDSQSGQQQKTRSSQNLFGWRGEIGGGWRGFHAEAGYDFYPYFSLGWSWRCP